MEASEQKKYSREAMDESVEHMAKAAFKADWPKDDWGRLGEGYHQARYRKMAFFALCALVAFNVSLNDRDEP